MHLLKNKLVYEKNQLNQTKMKVEMKLKLC